MKARRRRPERLKARRAGWATASSDRLTGRMGLRVGVMAAGRVSRRQFLVGGAAALGALRLADASVAGLPAPARSGLDHVVVVTMENRSFDHLLGWLPGADGKQAGLTYTDKRGVAHSTHPLAPDFQGCTHHDPEHGYFESRVAYNRGKCD